jgi:hypothetical protein
MYQSSALALASLATFATFLATEIANPEHRLIILESVKELAK